MMRRLAGTFDPSGRKSSRRLAGALAPAVATVLEQGPLRVAYSGPQAGSRAVLCLLAGCLDDASTLSAALEVSPASPEELLAAGWQRWGQELLPRLRGDFALLIWDRERGEGLLARDQLGVCSLFLYELDGALCFATEIRHLLALLPRRPSPDRLGLAHWVTGRGRPGQETLYAGVRRLEPGGVLRLHTRGVCEGRFWRPRYREPFESPKPELDRRVHEAIGLAVSRRLSPTGATGVLMSGGLDSAAVAAIAGARAPGSVAALCGVFPAHPAVDESGLIDRLRSLLRLPGITAEVRAGGLLASALESQRTWDIPMIGWGGFWTVPLLREAASTGVERVLGGDGGDELFAVRAHLAADRLRAGHPREALALVRRLPGAGYGPSPGEVAGVAANLALIGALSYRVHGLLRRPFAARELPRWLRPRATRELIDSEDRLAWKRLDGPRWWANAAHTLTRGVEELGVFEELRHTSMLAGVQARHPLFDLDLVELVLGGPPLCTFDPRLDRPVLRASMAGLLPDAVRLRARKALFDSLISDSLLDADGNAVRDLLTNPRAELGAIVDLQEVRRTLLEGDRGRRAHSFRSTQYVWRLVTAECWLQEQANPDRVPLIASLDVSPPRVALRTVAPLRRSQAPAA
jgi:asparagine synthase (glutamine-hydrolysing)